MQICLMLTGKREIRVDLKNREGQRLEDDQCHKQSKYRYNVRFVSFRFVSTFNAIRSLPSLSTRSQVKQ